MSDNNAANAGAQAAPPVQEQRAPFPAVRLLYAIAYSIVAWFVFWITLLLALVQLIPLPRGIVKFVGPGGASFRDQLLEVTQAPSKLSLASWPPARSRRSSTSTFLPALAR